MPEIEMNTFEGRCKFCGELQPIMAMDQMDADEKISEQCYCGGAEQERRKEALRQSLEDTIGKGAAALGLRQVSSEQETVIKDVAMAVFHGHLKSATCKIESSTITITAGAKIKVRRSDTQTQQMEV